MIIDTTQAHNKWSAVCTL